MQTIQTAKKAEQYSTVPASISQFKVALIGDGAVGKTSLMSRHKTGEFKRQYVPTIGAEVVPLDFFTSHGRVALIVWDTAGQEKFGMPCAFQGLVLLICICSC